MPERLMHILLIGLAGAAGTLSRFGLTALSHRVLTPLESSPWRAAVGTLTVNVVGSFLFGLVFALTAPSPSAGPAGGASGTDASLEQLRFVILIGFMGAFTTFSTFSFDALRLARESHWFAAAGYIALSVGVGIGALLAGLAAGAGRN